MHPLNILICDDAADDTDNLTHILDYSYGSAITTRAFCRANDALSYCLSGAAVDIVFLETVTERLNGIELAKALRSHGYGGEIIFHTRSKNYGPESYTVKATDYLLKPTMPEMVRIAMKKAENRLKSTGGDTK